MKKHGAIVIYTAHKGYLPATLRLRFNASCFTVGRDYLVVIAPQIFMLSNKCFNRHNTWVLYSGRLCLCLLRALDHIPKNHLIYMMTAYHLRSGFGCKKIYIRINMNLQVLNIDLIILIMINSDLKPYKHLL
ncbi:hypothetical protein AU894_19065 [Salmonella enterica subsp. enterica]|uniref:Uncharacterized protein n=1 Tax=Salmonella enterica subsp. enterica serovar Java TaxID=224729 RepID=A0A3Y9C2V3_SALEB|nr:hypothetical protein [Salmonella enterica subsp. enterica serovar Java]